MVKKIQVLDNGFVRLEDFMGGDQAVVRAARVSYGSTSADAEKDIKLISYLLAHQHGTPFEHAVFTFHVKLPIFCARQWIRHRISSYNEKSARYSQMQDEFYIPEEWRLQDLKNKQGATDVMTPGQNSILNSALRDHCEASMNLYRLMLKDNVGREMARMVLPVNLYTEWYWTVNARALMHFIGLRSDAHAQWEMRQYSHALAYYLQAKMPWTWTAFTTHVATPEKFPEMHQRVARLRYAHDA